MDKWSVFNFLRENTRWYRFLDSISYFKDSHNITKALEFVECEFNMIIVKNSVGTRLLTSDDRGDLSFTLYLAIKEKIEKNDKIAYLPPLQLCPIVNKCILFGNIDSFTFNFIHRAQTNTLPVNDHPRIKTR